MTKDSLTPASKPTFYDLGPDAICSAAEAFGGGRATGRFLQLNAMENRVYDVEMDEGLPRRIVKFYRPGRWTAAQILAEHRFLLKVKDAEVPVVAPFLNETGETLLDSNGILFTAFPRQGGRLEPELNPEQLKRLGRYLARIHNVGASMRGESRLKLDVKTYGRDSLATLKDGGFLTGGTGETYSRIVGELCEVIEGRMEGAFTVLLHGDCHAGNVLWRDDAPHFIDFDDMLYAPPVQDFWMLIGGSDDYALKNLATLIKSYEEIREFDLSSLALIEPLRTLRMIYFSAWIARRWEDGAFKAAFPYFGTDRYWQGQVEDLYQQMDRVQTTSALSDVARLQELMA